MGKLEKYHFGHLPVWADGNAYFAGAKPWKKEKDCCVKSEKPYFMLVEREGQIFLDTDVAELIGAFRGGLVDSDTLGRAFEPDQRFEAADGSTIVFDSDFYGNHRGRGCFPARSRRWMRRCSRCSNQNKKKVWRSSSCLHTLFYTDFTLQSAAESAA